MQVWGEEGGGPYPETSERVSRDGEEEGRTGFQAGMTHALGGTRFCKSEGCVCPEGEQGSAPAGPVESCRGIGTLAGGNGELPQGLQRKQDLDRFLVWKNYFVGSGSTG